MNLKPTREFMSKISLDKEQRDIIVGLMLGDGCLETQTNGRTYRLKIEQSLLHKEYVDWLYAKLNNLVLTSPKEKTKKIMNKIYKNYGFQTISSGNFRFFAQQFYDRNSKSKKIPKNIRKLLNPLVLSIWFMDDGQIKSSKHRALLINCQCFSKKDLRLLQDALKNKFGTESILKKERIGSRIYLLSETIHKFLAIVKPYIIPSMEYKLGRINTLPKE